MTKQEKINWLVDPGKFFPRDLRRGALCGNKEFIYAVKNYLSVLSESQFWSPEHIEEIQVLRLKNLISRLAARSPFWTAYFKMRGFFSDHILSTADITRLPVLHRSDLINFGEQIYISSRPDEGPVFTRRGLGTDGLSLKLTYCERELIMAVIPFLFRHPSLEKLLLDEMLSRKPFVILGTVDFRYACGQDFFNKEFFPLLPTDLENPVVRTEIYQSIKEAAPAFLMGFGSLLTQFAYAAADDNIELPLLAVRTCSESIMPASRAFIQQTFGAPVIDMLGCAGIGVVGFECPEGSGRFHVNSERVLLEVVDKNGFNMPRGAEGELVVTSFPYTLTPFIRYATGDTGRILSHFCRCGRRLPLFEFTGRRVYDMILPSGRRIGMLHLYTACMRSGLNRLSRQIQLIQPNLNNLRLLVVPKTPQKRLDEYNEINIRLALTELFGRDKINIDIEYVDTIVSVESNGPQFFVPPSEFNGDTPQ